MMMTEMNKAEYLADNELMAKVRDGDVESYEILINKYQGRLISYAYGILKNMEEAKDIVQDAFIRAYRKADYFSAEGNFTGWIYRIVGNLAKNRLKKLKKSYMVFSIDAEKEFKDGGTVSYEIEDDTMTPERMAENSQFAELLEEGVEQLNDNYRDIFIMRNMQDMSYEEIADELDLPLGTVKSRLNRARAQVKEYIDKRM